MTRYGNNEDIPEIVRIINSAFRVEDFFINGDRTTEADIAARMAEQHVRFLVIDAPESDALAATVMMDIHGDRGHFAMLSVDPAFQGRGFSRLLMNAVEDHCRAAGCTALDIEVVNLREELPAFYEANGFAPVGTLPFPDVRKLRRDAHMVRMTKSLSRK